MLKGKIIYNRGCFVIALNGINADIIKKSYLEKYEIPPNLVEYKNKRDGENSFHLTIISPEDTILKDVVETEINSLADNNFEIDIIGVGTNESCYYLVCLSKELDNFRKRLNLSSKDFHVTLAFNQADRHNISKGIDTLMPINADNDTKETIDKIINNLSNDTEKNIKILKCANNLYKDNYLIIKNLTNELSKKACYDEALIYANLLFELYPLDISGYYLYLMLSNKLSSFDPIQMKQIENNIIHIQNVKQKKIAFFIVKIINDIMIEYDWLESGADYFELLNYDTEKEMFEKMRFNGEYEKNNLKVVVSLNVPENNYFKSFVNKLNEIIITTNKNPNKHLMIYSNNTENSNNSFHLTELPINFSYVDDKLYGSGIVSARHIVSLKSIGINTIINLIGEEKPKEEIVALCKNHGIKLLHYGFPDRKACSFDLYLKIQADLHDPNNVSLVHCKGGIGRTNMVLAGFLMEKMNNPPSEAVAILKESRKVIMVPEQVMLLKRYYGHLTANYDNVSLPSNLRGLLLMVGIPCSGKSTLALEIYKKYSNALNTIIHLNQDEIGKSGCEEMLSSNAKSADLIILDRCNLTDKDRKYLIEMYRGLTDKKITVLFLNLGLDLSLKRLPERKNHLTLGAGGKGIIVQLSRKLIVPTKAEGYDELHEIKSIEELDKYKTSIGLNNCSLSNTTHNNTEEILLIKFPRTRHLANLGAMARDDLLMSKNDIESMLSGIVTVEEKIDGANLGFRLSSDGKIMAQNRSHFVSSSYHPQFKKLDQWIETNKFDLNHILSQGNYIIYGEWLYSKHSINYTDLPDYFIMFDLYDVDSNSFFSRDYIEEMLKDTNITLVPLIFKGKITMDKLKTLVHNKSQFYDGFVEGVYIRSFEGNKLKHRGKIVRSDFICGDEHWTKGKQILNTIRVR